MDDESNHRAVLEREEHGDAEAIRELRPELPQGVAVERIDMNRRPRAAALDLRGGAPQQTRKVIADDALDSLRVVALDVQRAGAFGRPLALAQQRLDRSAEDLRALLEAEVLVERDRVPVLRIDVKHEVGAPARDARVGDVAQQLAPDASTANRRVDPEIRDVQGGRAVVAEAGERIAHRAAVLLRDQRDALADHALDLRAFELGRILWIGQLGKLRLESFDERHQQVDVLAGRGTDVHAPLPA